MSKSIGSSRRILDSHGVHDGSSGTRKGEAPALALQCPRLQRLLLLGGEPTASTHRPKGRHPDGDPALLARIKAYGLFDCSEPQVRGVTGLS